MLKIVEGFPKPTKNCSSHLDISNEVLCAPKEDCMKELCPHEVDISITPLKTYSAFATLDPSARVLDILGFCILAFCVVLCFIIKMNFWHLCNLFAKKTAFAL